MRAKDRDDAELFTRPQKALSPSRAKDIVTSQPSAKTVCKPRNPETNKVRGTPVR